MNDSFIYARESMEKEIRFKNRFFESDIRKRINRKEGPVFESDIKSLTAVIYEWDSWGDDTELLYELPKLKELIVETNSIPLFLLNMPDLEELDLTFWGSQEFDFKWVGHLAKLKALCVSGGTISSMKLVNEGEILNLPQLTELILHEFGAVDLAFLKDMDHLTSFYCGYANDVWNIDAIANLQSLKELTLIDIPVKNLDFLNAFGNGLEIELCALWLPEGFNEKKLEELNRFERCDVCELRIGKQQIAFEIDKR